MKNFSFIIVALLCCVNAFNQSIATPAIIPQPVSMTVGNGTYTLPQSIIVSADKGMEDVIALLKEKLLRPTGYSITESSSQPTISLQPLGPKDGQLGQEGYKLSVTTAGITIKANTPAGAFYGVQTLLQLLPKEIESNKSVSGVAWQMPVVEITDYPRFGWRGLMFDVARHFFTKQDVKDFIDQMARYKYNLLHLHLADDEGWRLEIKSLPKLTEVGAWNVQKVGYFGTFPAPAKDEPRKYGGFFSHDDIRELVQYAKARFVDIMPEIDVPGHSLAAIASYPELSCTPGADKYVVRSGEKIMDWHGNGTFTALVDNTLCPANEKVYTFLDKVFTEVAELFPFPYIHMGGDETAKNFWEKSPQIKALMQREKLKDMHEVQSYFVKRVEKIIQSKGKKLIGWDEILEGGLAPSATVMSWRGMKGGIEAAKMGHEVVMSPTTFAYIDYMQGDPLIEPRVYATLRLSKAYEFEPVPEGIDAKYIKGGQANLWTEQIYNTRHMQYMVWPRGFAIAEAVWSPKEARSWDAFVPRVEAHMARYDEAGVKYAPSMFEPEVKVKRTANKGLQIELIPEVKDLTIHYTFDNSFPDQHYPKYEGPLLAPKEAVMLKVVTYRGNEQKGRIMNLPISELEKRAK